jgi:GMP synthase-like glutamine amidotransferase
MIKQSVLNTFKRVGINHENLDNTVKNVKVDNRFGGGSCETTQLIARLIQWVYATSNNYEYGNYSVKVSDFDRIRYFVLAEDSKAYMTCLD